MNEASDPNTALAQSINELMVKSMSPEGRLEYLEAVKRLNTLENTALTKARAVMSEATTPVETYLALWSCSIALERDRGRYTDELKGIIEREHARRTQTAQPTPESNTR